MRRRPCNLPCFFMLGRDAVISTSIDDPFSACSWLRVAAQYCWTMLSGLLAIASAADKTEREPSKYKTQNFKNQTSTLRFRLPFRGFNVESYQSSMAGAACGHPAEVLEVLAFAAPTRLLRTQYRRPYNVRMCGIVGYI